MISYFHSLLRKTPARYLYHRFKALRGSQSDEAEILRRLAINCPKTFVEFGFHPSEYNCIGLKDFSGLLIDGDAGSVKIARRLLPKHLQAEQRFLTLDNLDFIRTHHESLGVLSVDVDGNDYWFLEALLPLKPHVVSVEYNASFGRESLTVPYDPAFVRHDKHPSGWYHGASLAALTALSARHGMKLVAVSDSGVNAFFVRAGSPLPEIDPEEGYRENALRNRWSGTTAAEQWSRIREMPFVTI